MRRRIVAFALIVCMLIMAFPMGIIAEEVTETPEEFIYETASPSPEETVTAVATVSPEPTAAPAEELAVSPEPADEATVEPTNEPTAAPDVVESPAPTAEPSIYTDRDASFSPKFEKGYAEILLDEAEVCPENGEKFLLSRQTIVYVSKRNGSLLEVWLDTPDEVLCGWTKDINLRPMSEEEAALFITDELKRADVAFWNDDAAYPLALIETVVFPTKPDVYAVPSILTLPYETLTLGVGESRLLEPDVGGAQTTFSYSSSKTKYVNVSADGVVKGVKKGTSEITVRTDTGLTANVTVKVVSAPSKITASTKSIVLGAGENARLGYSLPKNTAGSVAFSSIDPEIASVDPETGAVTAVNAGSTKILIQTYNGKKAYTTVTVKPAPEAVIITPEATTIGVGQAISVQSTVNEGAAGGVTLTSANESILAASGDSITGVAPGVTELIATAYNGVSARIEITVLPAPEKVTLPYTSLTIGVGEIVQLTPDCGDTVTGITYKSSKTKYVKVAADGRIGGAKAGTAKVTVSTYNGKSAQLTVTVRKAPGKVTASPNSLVLGVGETGRLGYSLPKNTAGSVTFSSANPEIATVDAKTGEVTAVSAGTVNITIQTYNGKKAYAAVTVKIAPEKVNIVPEAFEIGVGQVITVNAHVNEASAGAVALTSGNEKILAASGNKITGVAPGTAELVATAYNGVSERVEITVLPAPEKVTLPYTTLTIGVGEIVQLTPDCGGVSGSFTYKSSKPKYVKVAADGRIGGAKAGTSKVTVSTYNGKTAAVTVKVLKAPGKISISQKTLELGVGETSVLSYALPKNTAGSVTFSSANPDIATVDANTGKVTAVSAGTTNIVVQTFNGKKASTSVTVKNAPEYVNVSPASTVVGVGQILNVKASVNEGAAGKVVLSSSDERILVAADNRFKGVAPGTAELIVTAYNGVSTRTLITVLPAPAKVTLPYTTLKIGVGEIIQLAPDAGEGLTGFTYKSSKTKYVKVNAEGMLQGVKAGTSKITVSTYNGKKAYANIVVCAAPKAVAISDAELTIGIGQTHRLIYKLPDKSAGSVSFSSSNPAIASVNENTGVITALAAGEAEITLTTYNGKTARCKVTVCKAPDTVSLGMESAELAVGQTLQLNPVISEDSRTVFTYSVDNKDVLSISADGKITALKRGAATVRVATHVSEVYAELKVTVWDAPTSVSLKEKELRVLINDTIVLAPEIPDGSITTFIYSSSHPEVATVAADGTVNTLSIGKTTLTVTTHNGKTASMELTVWDPLYPEKLEILNAPDVLDKDAKTYELQYKVEPDTADTEVIWKSANPDVATVSENGVISLHGYGYSVITAVSVKNPDLSASFTLGVQLENLTLTIPARVTQENGIKSNLAKIDNIRKSAITQVEALQKGGVISSADASKRKSMINNIFADYAFPWKTPELQPYWKAANSEGGVKDFKPDRVYYGMPYMSGSYSNRCFNSAKALSQNRYVDTGKGYYMLNRKNLLNGTYVGNDCSALVNMAIWGTNSSHTNDRTDDIAVSKAYRTIEGYKNMRPGDLLCKSKRHVVMFLYYANPEKTKIMIIENGGLEAGTNTVHCAVHDISYYMGIGYQVRRLNSLD
ncbi:MAG: Ig-like domain-containing protein [Clostridia bacterium]|nr:Ig-like domain-containing protein [Clostridia bacterium]